MVAVLALAGLVLSGCLSYPDDSREFSPSEKRVVMSVWRAWSARGDLPPPGGRCRDYAGEYRIAVLGDAAYEDRCGACPPVESSGRRPECAEKGVSLCCYDRVWTGVVPFAFLEHPGPLAVLHESSPRAHSLAHETIHMLGDCTGLGSDHDHADERRWRGESSVWERSLAD